LQNPYWLILSAKILLVNGRSTTADSTGINRLPQAQARPARAAARANRRCIPSPRWQDGARIEPQETDRRSLRRGATSKPASKAAEVWNNGKILLRRKAPLNDVIEGDGACLSTTKMLFIPTA
jgi:hypothetical protein